MPFGHGFSWGDHNSQGLPTLGRATDGDCLPYIGSSGWNIPTRRRTVLDLGFWCCCCCCCCCCCWIFLNGSKAPTVLKKTDNSVLRFSESSEAWIKSGGTSSAPQIHVLLLMFLFSLNQCVRPGLIIAIVSCNCFFCQKRKDMSRVILFRAPLKCFQNKYTFIYIYIYYTLLYCCCCCCCSSSCCCCCCGSWKWSCSPSAVSR